MKNTKEQQCRICGCTENQACPGGCTWVEDDLCNKCLPKYLKARRKEVAKELKRLEDICKYRDDMWKEEIKKLRSKKFKRGERPWCVECVSRFSKELLKQLKQK